MSLWLPSSSAYSIHFTLAAFDDGTHLYYHELLRKSLESQGHQVSISSPWKHLPQKRVLKMVENGSLSLHWILQTPDRDKKYTPVELGLTNSLIGHRILLIPKDAQPIYDSLNNLEDFRKAGFRVEVLGKGK